MWWVRAARRGAPPDGCPRRSSPLSARAYGARHEQDARETVWALAAGHPVGAHITFTAWSIAGQLRVTVDAEVRRGWELCVLRARFNDSNTLYDDFEVTRGAAAQSLLVRLAEYAHVRVLGRSQDGRALLEHFLLSVFRDEALGDMSASEKRDAEVARRARAVPDDYVPGNTQQLTGSEDSPPVAAAPPASTPPAPPTPPRWPLSQCSTSSSSSLSPQHRERAGSLAALLADSQ